MFLNPGNTELQNAKLNVHWELLLDQMAYVIIIIVVANALTPNICHAINRHHDDLTMIIISHESHNIMHLVL